MKWLSSPFKQHWYLLTHPDPIHKGIYWRLYTRIFCPIPPFYKYYLKAELIDKYPYGKCDNPLTIIYNGIGINLDVFIKLSIQQGIGTVHGNTKDEFKKDLKEMNQKKMTNKETEEFLFAECL